MTRTATTRPAFTLLEVLLALVLTGLLLAATSRVASTSLALRDHVHGRGAAIDRAAYVMDTLADDVAFLLHQGSGTTEAVHARSSHLELTVLAVPGHDHAALHVPRVPSVVTYRVLAPMIDGQRPRLIRTVLDMTRAGAKPHREVLCYDIRALEVLVAVNEQWITPAAVEEGSPIAAVRVTCRWTDHAEAVSRIFLIKRDAHDNASS